MNLDEQIRITGLAKAVWARALEWVAESSETRTARVEVKPDDDPRAWCYDYSQKEGFAIYDPAAPFEDLLEIKRKRLMAELAALEGGEQ